MCSRYTVYTEDDNSLMKTFLTRAGLNDVGEIYPASGAPILHCIDGIICARRGVWGFPSFNSKVIFNARVETVTVKDMFSRWFEKSRCIIPATAFYEWDHKSAEGKKILYKFTLPYDDMIYMCGFYKIVDGEKRYVILTTEASDDMSDIHTRMPAIIPREKVREYLKNDFTCYDIACSLPPKLIRRVFTSN